MASIEKRTGPDGKPRYRARVRRKGRTSTSRTFRKLTEARAWATEIEEGGGTLGNHTVAELIDRYVTTVCPLTKTGHRKAQQLATWRELLGSFRLDRLRPADIAQARDVIGKDRAPGTVVRYLAALSHAFTVAIKDWYWVDTNPTASIIWPREPRGRVRFLSDDERDRLLVACHASKLEPLADIVTLALLSGMRKGEILGLRGSNVDLKRRRLILTETKNGERRQIPLVPKAFDLVKRRTTAPGILLFCHPRRPRVELDIRRDWFRALSAAGVDDFRFHDLRHTAASYLAMTGATTNEIAEILGHKTLSMVKRYAHLTTTHSATVLERMETGIFGDSNP